MAMQGTRSVHNVAIFCLLLSALSLRVLSASVPHFEKFGPLQSVGAWQLPGGPIRKVLVIFEGRGVFPTDFWKHSSTCPSCIGLPENRKIVEDALALNYAVFLPQSIILDGNWESWPLDNPETRNFFTVLSEWRSSHKLEELPMIGLGMSAGGRFLSTLALVPNLFSSIAIMISDGIAEAFATATPAYPPTIFIHMPKDEDTAAAVKNARFQRLRPQGIPTAEEKWFEHAVTEDWFADSIPGLGHNLSSALHAALRREGWLDERSDFLTSDLFHNDWNAVVSKLNVLPKDPFCADCLMFQHSIFQEMNVAFAFHVSLARLNLEMFSWFEGGYELRRDNLATD